MAANPLVTDITIEPWLARLCGLLSSCSSDMPTLNVGVRTSRAYDSLVGRRMVRTANPTGDCQRTLRVV
ncbi:MAG TPA: hypothetical protein P5081_24400 [Phycisphaerae bacterium]|nr:hypothetical protein [Phycisphaerae bacterium]HRW56029.1 hypothetical protein [Phycisphaerae bacterium]